MFVCRLLDTALWFVAVGFHAEAKTASRFFGAPHYMQGGFAPRDTGHFYRVALSDCCMLAYLCGLSLYLYHCLSTVLTELWDMLFCPILSHNAHNVHNYNCVYWYAYNI